MRRSEATTCVVLLVGTGKWLAELLEDSGHSVVEAPNSTRALRCIEDTRPDVVVIQDALPDMSGIDACRLLRARAGIDPHLPLLVLTADRPSPAQRVAGLRSGVWDFLWNASDRAELLLKLEAYIQAKWSLSDGLPHEEVLAAAVDTGELDAWSGPGSLIRRARDLGAVLMRRDGALACAQFRVPPDIPRVEARRSLMRHTRHCDVVGVWDPVGLTVVAPWADLEGGFRLALRVGEALRADLSRNGLTMGGTGLPVGYDAVASLILTPLDPTELLLRAAAALHDGEPDPQYPWVRRFRGGSPGGARVARRWSDATEALERHDS